jgi:hypothetical protein
MVKGLRFMQGGGTMESLIDGFKRFRAEYFEEHRRLFEALASRGQMPKVLLIGCCDSRVDPAIIFDAQPGEMFVLRNVANLVPPYAPTPATTVPRRRWSSPSAALRSNISSCWAMPAAVACAP